jgi:hypothetical protein
MSITSITRDWGIVPSIVRIVSSDTLAVVGAAGYITAQQANIENVNNGAFEWATSDSVLVYASNGSAFFTISPDFTSLLGTTLTTGVLNGITATAGGRQTDGFPLTAYINRVTTVATTGDSVLLPPSIPGSQVIVINAGGNNLDVYPQVGDAINGAGVNSPLVQTPGRTNDYICAAVGQWNVLIGAATD